MKQKYRLGKDIFMLIRVGGPGGALFHFLVLRLAYHERIETHFSTVCLQCNSRNGFAYLSKLGVLRAPSQVNMFKTLQIKHIVADLQYVYLYSTFCIGQNLQIYSVQERLAKRS
jgi:hypothetical protein